MTKEKDLVSVLPPSLVFLDSNGINAIPLTTSEAIAEGTRINHRRIRDAIRRYKPQLEAFGVLGAYQTETPNNKEGGRKAVGYLLNEQQATFLITLLKNTPVVVAFKEELVRQFYLMREELTKRRVARIEGKPIRRSLTDALRDSGENERMKGHAYGTYTNLAYKLATGKGAAQLRRERGARKGAVAADFLTAAELAAYQKQEAAITALLDAGLRYDRIKAVFTEKEAKLCRKKLRESPV